MEVEGYEGLADYSSLDDTTTFYEQLPNDLSMKSIKKNPRKCVTFLPTYVQVSIFFYNYYYFFILVPLPVVSC